MALQLIRAVADIIETVILIVNTSIYPMVVKRISFWVVIGIMLSLLILNLAKMLKKIDLNKQKILSFL